MFNDLLRKMLNTRDDTGRFSLADIQKNRLMALLSYLWLGWIVPRPGPPRETFTMSAGSSAPAM